MIRLSLLTVFVLGLAIYAWRDWYKSLCGLILLMAVVERPDMPKEMFGIPGLNPWNLLLLNIVLAWAASRRRERLVWDMPRHVNLLLLLYLGVVIVAFVRMMVDRTYLEERWTAVSLTNDFLINPIKWTIPGLLFFDGCRSRRRLTLGLFGVLGMYLVLALLVIKWVPPRYALDAAALEGRTARVLDRGTGYHRVDMSMMLAGASWATLAAASLMKRPSHKLCVVAAGLAVVYAQALTAGRAGYIAWAVVGVILGGLRWRRYFLLAPFLLAALVFLVPGSVGRLFEGISGEERLVGDQIDRNKLTAGRSQIWPYVIDKIGDSPLFGYGRLAMRRTGLTEFVRESLRDRFGHPHNAYLELLLDNGWVGFCLIIPFYLLALFHGLRLLRDSRSPAFVATGGVASALVLALLVASLGSQTFYPREGTVGMWCALGLLFRVSVERSRVLGQARAAAVRIPERAPDSSPRVVPIRPATSLAARPHGHATVPRASNSIDSRLWARAK